MSGYFALDPRPLLPEDSQGTRVLLLGSLGVTPYIDRALEVLELAERGHDPEHRALVIARDGTVAGLALFGAIAGTQHAARLYTAVLAPGVQTSDVGARLMRSVSEAARDGRRAIPARRTARRSGDRDRARRCCASTASRRKRASPTSIATASR